MIRDLPSAPQPHTTITLKQPLNLGSCPKRTFLYAPKIHFINGPHRCEGRVEVEKEGHWGTMCDDGWDMKDVALMCQELGCGAAGHTPTGVVYLPVAEEDQPVFIQVGLCNGAEEALAECEQV